MGERTSLYDKHIKSGAQMVEFCGWEMPVQYSSIIKEVGAVRSGVGMFDCSHMGEFMISGPCALDFIQKASANDALRLKIGQIQYSFLCNEKGGVIDDILVYRLGGQDYMFVVNAGNMKKDWDWLNENIIPGVSLNNISDITALIAVQGPYAKMAMRAIFAEDDDENNTYFNGIWETVYSLKYYHFNFINMLSAKLLISRTGYTGEDGFEIFCHYMLAREIWDNLLVARFYDVTPCGLGARDVLRLEAGMPLWGHELDEETTPIEAGLQRYVYSGKDFRGKEAIFKKAGIGKRLVGFEMDERSIARNSNNKVYDINNDREIGYVTSGTWSPTLNKSIGMAYMPFGYFMPGRKIMIDIRGNKHLAKIIDLPFYKLQKIVF